jgi:NADPH:quinone reductase-like Zn-dependent oxidoreductase
VERVVVDAGAIRQFAARRAEPVGRPRAPQGVGGDHRARRSAASRRIGIDYTKPDWFDEARAASGGVGSDIIYESVGGDVTKGCLTTLAPGGELVIYGALNIQGFAFGVPELLGIIFKNQSLTGFALLGLVNSNGLKTGQFRR